MTLSPLRRRRRDQAGAAAVIMSVFVAALMIPLGAIGVDVARWYVEAERVQAAADAAATAGVTFMPDDFAKARARALEIAEDNGYSTATGATVTVEPGHKPTQLRVTVAAPVTNQFGRLFGNASTSMSRAALADFNGPAPMGSPCNSFANEPPGSVGKGPTTSVIKVPAPASCPQEPEFWASISGPEVAKDQGSQFEARKCWGGEDGCAGTSRGSANDDFDARGLIYLVRVTPAAVGRSVDLQIYDPATVPGGFQCLNAPTSNIGTDTPNPRTADGTTRYSRSANKFCTGDDTSSSRRFGSEVPTVTSFGLRAPIDTLNPYDAPAVPGCAKQFGGYANGYATRDRLRSASGSYDAALAEVFHQWVSLCSFTPTQAGDYYLQVRTNVPSGNASKVYTQTGDDTSVKGNSINSFALRADSSAAAGAITIAAYDKMRIFANADSADTSFNLVRVVPAAASKTLVVSFFDVGEGASSGSVQLVPPTDAKVGGVPMTTATGCTADGVTDVIAPSSLVGCKITGITESTYNGKLQYIYVPIPANYDCQSTSSGGCWWRVKVSFGTGEVRDATTWTANIGGEPIRLIE